MKKNKTLRDEIALIAFEKHLDAVINLSESEYSEWVQIWGERHEEILNTSEHIAKDCYEFADAMIKERDNETKSHP